MSTFSGLNTAYTGLQAARAGLDVVGQNIANVNTEGYTRQRISTSATGPVAATGLFSGGVRAGQGVSVDGIARLGSMHLDARVRSSAAAAGFSDVRSSALATLEDSLQEPGENGLSARLQDFWAGWQDLSNQAGKSAPASVLLSRANVLTSQIASGYQQIDAQWTQVRGEVDTMVTELNGAATRVAELNGQIHSTLAAGGSVNELLDQRSLLTATIASLTGASVRESDNGMVDVVIAGNSIVSGDSFFPVEVSGASQMEGATGVGVHLQWAARPDSKIPLDGGEIAGALSLLAPADDGGALAEAAAFYNGFAINLAGQVNAAHQMGQMSSGAPGGDFFELATGLPPALGISVVPTGVEGIATGAVDAGAFDGTNADAIAQLGDGDGSPDALWSAFVTRIGVAARAENEQASLSGLAHASAVNRQLSNSSVSLDEENVNLLMHQHAYQGAARVMTAVDEMLDTLINRTGLVGR